MTAKTKIELEYILHTSPKVLEGLIFTPAGLSEWFADKAILEDEILTFTWDKSSEQARLLTKKTMDKIRWRYLTDEDDGMDTFCEITYTVDSLTKEVALIITDFCEEDDIEESKMLWDQQVDKLKRVLGA